MVVRGCLVLMVISILMMLTLDSSFAKLSGRPVISSSRKSNANKQKTTNKKKSSPYSPLVRSSIARPKSARVLDPVDEEYSIYSFEEVANPAGGGAVGKRPDSAALNEKEQLYEAYNLLHTLAQDFQKPFDAPAVIVVGHQTSGKSALIEALMGFQFNQVGGGTKTRRPVALRMQYNPNCLEPSCYLTLDSTGKEEPRSLADIQAFIEAENRRLERDPTRSFDPREINVRMEYRYCPNMIVIDTPGMIHPPKGRQLTPQQRALAHAAREAEALVLNKIRCQDYIILCVEDTTDWKHATTRNVVMQADPQLARTVLVTTKLDTKLPQFSEPEDLQEFLQAPLVRRIFSQLLGGPFFTSVPSGRVGSSKEYDTNDAFVQALKQTERSDRGLALRRLGPVRARDCLQGVGVSRLRTFLETCIEDSYRRNVAKIVPLLQTELRHTEQKLAKVEKELDGLSLDHLRVLANNYRESFSKQLNNVIQGTVRVSPEDWGETLDAEAMKSGSFLHQQGQVRNDVWQRALDSEVGNSRQKLFGGAQYHRAIKEFTLAVRHMVTPTVTEDEIANAAGIGDRHNGVNFMRAACVIAMEKAQLSFDPMLESLRTRAIHIMKRLYPMVEDLVHKNLDGTVTSRFTDVGLSSSMSATSATLDTHCEPFQHMMREIYERFVEQQMELCLRKCRDDLYGMTRFVTWDVDDQGGSSTLYRMLPTPKKMVEIYNVALEKKQNRELEEGSTARKALSAPRGRSKKRSNKSKKSTRQGAFDKNFAGTEDDLLGTHDVNSSPRSAADRIFDDWAKANGVDDSSAKDKKKKKKTVSTAAMERTTQTALEGELTVAAAGTETDDAELADYYQVMQLTEEMLSGTTPTRTSALVSALVQFITNAWRNHFARSTAMKFNCFFLMPFLDDFPDYLRNELDRIYESGVGELFDITETRRALQSKRADLLAECNANSKLQNRFDTIASQLNGAYSDEVPTNEGDDHGDDHDDGSNGNHRPDPGSSSSFSDPSSSQGQPYSRVNYHG